MMGGTEPSSLGGLVRGITRILAESEHVLDANQEALWIVTHVTARATWEVWAKAGEPVRPEHIRGALDLAHSRAHGEPLQYLLGDAVFLGRRFLCDRRALIPRPETEVLVEGVVARATRSGSLRLADVCTGSGCVGVSLALEMPGASVTATDLSPEALSLAAENSALHGVEGRVECRAGDLFDSLDGLYDVVAINPPYIPSAEIDALGPDIAAEPRMALDGGTDGLDMYRRIAQRWREYTRPGCLMALEIGAGQAQAVCGLLGTAQVEIVPDQYGVERALFVRRP